ncbi:MAG: S24/S26 family peptidase [Henriciella sp.]|nr:S24/S26 family peptidase [Henriciella sp.]
MLGWSLIRVTGESMHPMLSPGTFALFRRSASYRDGDVLLVEHPRFGRIVKRAIDVGKEALWLEGANANSLSRETMGPIEQRLVQGKLVYQIARKK